LLDWIDEGFITCINQGVTFARTDTMNVFAAALPIRGAGGRELLQFYRSS
jgi:hypothetical protein